MSKINSDVNIYYETKEAFWELGSLRLGSLVLLSDSHLVKKSLRRYVSGMEWKD